jgi:hypothetical protein
VFRFRSLGISIRLLGCWFWARGLGFRVEGFRVYGFIFSDPGLGFRDKGLGICISGYRLRA